MSLKPLIIAGVMVFATSVFAQQNTQSPQSTTPQQPQTQTPTSGRTNAQGEQPAAGRTMQEKESGLMNQSGGTAGTTGSTGTQSGAPNTGATK